MNKFLILIVMFLFISHFSSAQTEKGSQTLGANFGFNYSQDNSLTIYVGNNTSAIVTTKTTDFNIGPNYSYFIADKLDIGAALSYSYTGTTNTTPALATDNYNYPVKQSSNNFGVSVFIRKYYMFNKIGFRTGAYLGYSGGNTKNTYTTSQDLYNYNATSNYYNAGANLDLVFYPSKNLGVAATIANLEYVHYKNDTTTQGHDSTDSINFNFVNNGLSLSVFYVFGSKSK
jgi:hypothetical protein